MRKVLGCAAVMLLIAGCAVSPQSAQAPPVDRTPRLTGEGILIGSTPIPFGTPAGAAEEALLAAWGQPETATEWGGVRTSWGFCGGTTLRVLTWGGVHVLFTDVLGRKELTGWRWDNPQGPEGIGVARNSNPSLPVVHVGDTLSQVVQSYPDADAPEDPFYEEYTVMLHHERLTRYTPLLESAVSGLRTGPGVSDTVSVLEAGSLCGF